MSLVGDLYLLSEGMIILTFRLKQCCLGLFFFYSSNRMGSCDCTLFPEELTVLILKSGIRHLVHTNIKLFFYVYLSQLFDKVLSCVKRFYI